MLAGLRIRNFAVIEDAELAFAGRLTALTGETGAGKSLVVDALLLALGERADAAAVRAGSPRAEVTAAFVLDDAPQVRAWLAEHELDEGDECVLRRTLSADGRSRCYVNERPVPAPRVRELGQHLVEIHGQHAYQALLRADAQRRLLDRYGGCEALAAAVRASWGVWRTARDALEAARAGAGARAAELENLRHHVAELTALNLAAGEWEALETEQRRLGHLEALTAGVGEALMLIEEAEDANAVARLARAAPGLRRLGRVDDALTGPADLLEEALALCREAATGLRRYAAGLDADPQRAQAVDARLRAGLDLARKHAVPPTELPALTLRLTAELAELENPAAGLAGLERALVTARADYDAAAARLRGERTRAAGELASAVTAQLAGLGMGQARLEVGLEATGEEPQPDGSERVELRLSPHGGETPLPLTRVASGGELSRLSLAIEVVTLAQGEVPTVILDEVDVGIGGSTATTVGALLRRLGGARQVICVTHLPQVAAHAHQHLRVVKRSARGSASTRVEPLAADMRVTELARMLGGAVATARAHAAKLLAAGTQSP